MSEVEIFPWNAYFEVDVKEIDEQHKELVKIINEICSYVLTTKNYEETIDSLFVRLVDYTKFHFECEEKYFEQNALPDDLLTRHQKYHSGLISKALLLKKKFDTAPNKDTNLEEILTTLVLWLTNHILNDDMRLCMIIANMGEGMTPEQATSQAEVDMDGPKGTVARVMGSMMHVSSASVLELRREITFRKKLEEQLTEEISVRKAAEEQLSHLAHHDPLTGLPNRRLFDELGELAMSQAKRSKLEQSILFADIDGFKKINDTLGHKAGDALLVSISQRLKECVRDSDIVARIGGDEFVIYLGGECSASAAKVIASKIINSISTPFELEEGVANVGASVGISVYPSDAEDITTLVKYSDDAMYVAKKSGKNAYKLFNEC